MLVDEVAHPNPYVLAGFVEVYRARGVEAIAVKVDAGMLGPRARQR